MKEPGVHDWIKKSNKEADAKSDQSHSPYLSQLSKGKNVHTYQDRDQATSKPDYKKKATIWIVFLTSALMTIQSLIAQKKSHYVDNIYDFSTDDDTKLAEKADGGIGKKSRCKEYWVGEEWCGRMEAQ